MRGAGALLLACGCNAILGIPAPTHGGGTGDGGPRQIDAASPVDATPDAIRPDAGALIITTVTVREAPAGTREGHEGGYVHLDVTGMNLDQTVSATLGDSMTYPDTTNATNGTITIGAYVGPTPGLQDLTLTGYSGHTATFPGALDVTVVAVSTTGSDSNPGTPSAPYQTLHMASQNNLGYGTISLAAGTYTDSNVSLGSATVEGNGATLMVPAGSNMEGFVGFGTVQDLTIIGGPCDAAFDAQSGSSGFTVTNVTVSGCAYGVWSYGGTTHISMTTINAAQDAVWVRSAQVTIDQSDLSGVVMPGHVAYGIYLDGATNILVTNTRIHDEDVGVVVAEDALTSTTPTGIDLTTGDTLTTFTYQAIEDQRPSRNDLLGVVIQATGATINGTTGTGMTFIGPDTTHVPIFKIDAMNNQLRF
jgi:hypothetical protein